MHGACTEVPRLNPESLIPDSLIPESFEEDDSSAPPVTRETEVCLVVQKIGIVDSNPKHPRLSELLDRGAMVQDFACAAPIAQAAGKGFSYLLGVVDGKLRDEATKQTRAATRPRNRDSPETFRERDERLAAERLSIFCPSLAPKHYRNNLQTFDVEAKNVTALALD